MLCRFCGKDPSNPVIPLPGPYKPASMAEYDPDNPEHSMWACEKCAVEHGYFCTEHIMAHTQFGNVGGHGCEACIEEEAGRLQEEVLKLLQDFPDTIAHEDYQEMWENIQLAADITKTPPERCLARLIVSTAIGREMTSEQIIAEIRSSRDITIILPHPLGL
jgi:hypothetical protein